MKFIITGHGHFATGLLSSVKLITGMDSAFEAIDFKESMSSKDLNTLLSEYLDSVSSVDSIVIFTDIAGGTPFNQSVLLKNQRKNIEIVAGTNLPILVEAALSQEKAIRPFLDKILDSGKSSIKEYVTRKTTSQLTDDCDDGI